MKASGCYYIWLLQSKYNQNILHCICNRMGSYRLTKCTIEFYLPVSNLLYHMDAGQYYIERYYISI